jgi:hypothetical protein
MKRKLIDTFFFFLLFLVLVWFVNQCCYIKRCKCSDWPEYKKANEIIKKVESYRKKNGVLPNSLEDIGEETTMDGPVYYDKIKSDLYVVSFSLNSVGESCTYYSDTKKWNDEE